MMEEKNVKEHKNLRHVRRLKILDDVQSATGDGRPKYFERCQLLLHRVPSVVYDDVIAAKCVTLGSDIS